MYTDKQKKIENRVGPFKDQTPEEKIEINMFMHYESIITNLKAQKRMVFVLNSTDRLTMIAYRVALISLGASLISIVGNVFK